MLRADVDEDGSLDEAEGEFFMYLMRQDMPQLVQGQIEEAPADTAGSGLNPADPHGNGKLGLDDAVEHAGSEGEEEEEAVEGVMERLVGISELGGNGGLGDLGFGGVSGGVEDHF